MRRALAVVAALLVLASCGGGGEDELGEGPIRVIGPPSLGEVLDDMAALYEEEGRGIATIDLTEDVVADAEGADIAITEGEADLEALADAGFVESEAWNRITAKDGVEYWAAQLDTAPNADGAFQWVSFASGASPWQIFEDHGFESPLSE